jgi:hypothetical protein
MLRTILSSSVPGVSVRETRTIRENLPTRQSSQLQKLVADGRSLSTAAGTPANVLAFDFSPPNAGWITFSIVTDGRTIAWRVPNAPDPFFRRGTDVRETFRPTFMSWLEDIALDKFPALAIDMEGPAGALVVLPKDDASVKLAVMEDPGGVAALVVVNRTILLSSFYRSLIAFWESDGLSAAWAEWSASPRWSLRSEIVEAALPESGAAPAGPAEGSR